MKLFGLDIRLDKSYKSKGKEKAFTRFGSNGYSFVGNNIGACGDIVIGQDTFYNIQRENNEALAYKNKIVSMVGQGGAYIKDTKGEDIFEGDEVERINFTFSSPTFRRFKDRYFTQKFCSGEITMYPAQTATGEIKAQILDSRTIDKEIDGMGNVVLISQTGMLGDKNATTWTLDEIYHNILLEDPNRPQYGLSLYNGIVMDALADAETSKRQLYFFKNDSRPNMFVMLDSEQIQSQDEIDNAIEMLQNKYAGSENSHKAMVAPFIKDVKVLELTNKDLDLLNLRKFAIQKLGIAFQIDPRLIGFKDGGGGNNAEYIQVARESSEMIRVYAREVEENMTNFYKQFVNKNFEGQIRLKSDSFDDEITILQLSLDAINAGMINRVEARQRVGLSIDTCLGVGGTTPTLPSDLEKFTIPKSTINLEDIDNVLI